jgi:hypothetical protein
MGCGEGDQIHQQYTSILNLLQCEPIAVPVEGQCELVFGTCPTPTSDSFLSAPYDVRAVLFLRQSHLSAICIPWSPAVTWFTVFRPWH